MASEMDFQYKDEDLAQPGITHDKISLLKTKKPTILRIFVMMGFWLLFFVLSIVLYSHATSQYDLTIEKEKYTYYFCTIAYYSVSFLAIWSFVDIVIAILIFSVSDKGSNNFGSLFLIHEITLISLVCSLILFSTIICIIVNYKNVQISNQKEHAIVNGETKESERDISDVIKGENMKETGGVLFEKTPVEISLNKFKSLVFYIALSFVLILIKKAIQQFASYNIYYKYYKERIDENNERMNDLSILSKKAGKRKGMHLHQWAEKVFFSILKPNQTELILNDFIYHFGKGDASRIFSCFDENHDNSVSRDEFIAVYQAIHDSEERLELSLAKKNRSLSKLTLILDGLFTPLILLTVMSIFLENAVANAYKTMLGVVLPLSFIFGSVVSEIFQSILFIFGIRPFDIGDHIIIDNEEYHVIEMGLLYSSFSKSGKFTNIPNDKLRKAYISNYRRTNSVVETIVQEYIYSTCKDKLEILKSLIQDFLNENNKSYKGEFQMSQYEIFKGINIKLTIKITVKKALHDTESIRQRKDEFILFLKEKVDELLIVCA